MVRACVCVLIFSFFQLKLVEMLDHAMSHFKTEADEERQQRQADIATEQNRLQLLARVLFSALAEPICAPW